MFAGNFAPAGWALCQGQLLPISGNDALFNLIGTTYGGDGQQTFALPNLGSRIPMHTGSAGGSSHVLGESGGAETVTLTTSQIPSHSHATQANTSGNVTSPSGAVWAGTTDISQFAPASSINGQMNANAVAIAGGSQPHENRPPYLGINFIISLFGVFPSQT